VPTGISDYASNCNGKLNFGIVPLPSGGAALLYCAANSMVKIAMFPDHTFQAATATFDTGIAAPVPNDNSGDFTAGIIDSPDQMLAYALSNTVIAFGLGRPNKVVVVDTTIPQATSVPFNQLNTQGRFEYSRAFITSGDPHTSPADVQTVASWDNDHTIFAASPTIPGGTWESLLIDLNARTTTQLHALDGDQIKAAVRLDTDHVLVSGYDASGNPLNLLLDNTGAVASAGGVDAILKVAAPR
jgi:hypothetical protein